MAEPDDAPSRSTGAGTPPSPAGPPPEARAGQSLGRRLGGDLPCVVCKYNLKGVSIREACPECGTAVRATILAMVDPYACELMPIARPRLVAAGLIAWALGALVASLLGWAPYLLDVHSTPWRVALVASIALSGMGALSLIHPHAGIRDSHRLMALLGVLLYVPIAWLAWQLTSSSWLFSRFSFPPLSLDLDAPPRAMFRVLLDASVVLVLLLLRPNARLLVARSLALRMGRVDRQTMLAMVAAASAAGIGDLVWLTLGGFRGTVGDASLLLARILVVMGSVLLTLGSAGVLIDSYRIARAILVPTPSLAQVITGDTKRSS